MCMVEKKIGIVRLEQGSSVFLPLNGEKLNFIFFQTHPIFVSTCF